MPNDATQQGSLSERVLGAIEEEGIAPKPRWHFLLYEWVIWLMALVAFVLGSIATALSLYISNASYFMEETLELSRLDVLFEMVPMMWLTLFSAGIFYTIHALRNTKRGYRWHPSWLVLLAITASLGMGYTLHASGISASIDRYLLTELPYYKSLTGHRPMHWMDPNAGVVAGVVYEVNEEAFVLHTIDGQELYIEITPETVTHGFMVVEEGMPVRVVGTTTDQEATMQASDIGPFRGRGVPGQGVRGPRALRQHRNEIEDPEFENGVQMKEIWMNERSLE